MIYQEDDYLMISGIQHFAFCRRQWALIHIENAWAENLRTTEGRLMHSRAHDNSIREKRGDIITMRGVSISSPSLGVSGQCDVVEFRKSDDGIKLHGEEGLWKPYPVEYKRGVPKDNLSDKLQLCAQAMCLEEMYCSEVPDGALYYGEIRRRDTVVFTDELRNEVRKMFGEMHELFHRGYTPKVKTTKGCNACSLKEICIPRLNNAKCVSEYIENAMEDG